jgi:hypothetical protein
MADPENVLSGRPGRGAPSADDFPVLRLAAAGVARIPSRP